ncbi:MAG: AAA family ATPase [Patescibacteria group bacterium]
MNISIKNAPPADYDRGRHDGYVELLKEIEEKILPRFIVGKKHLENCRKINRGLIADGQMMPASSDDSSGFIPGSGNTFAYGVPGAGKTLIGLVFSKIYSLPFQRIQFTSDLLPSDLIGAHIFNQKIGDYEIRYGPLGKGRFILADELPRATPKTQSALLEVMESWSLSIWDASKKTDPQTQVFFVFATGNPIETEGVFPMSEALLDRFAQFLIFDHLNETEEMKQMLEIPKQYAAPESLIPTVMNEKKLVKLRNFRRSFVYLDEAGKDYMVRIVRATRDSAKEEKYFSGLKGYNKKDFPRLIKLGVSDRALGMFFGNLAMAETFRLGRLKTEPEDIKAVAADCLSHRLILSREGNSLRKEYYPYLRELEFKQLLIRKILDETPVYSKRKF